MRIQELPVKNLLALLLLACTFSLNGQSPYEFSAEKDGVILGLSGSILAGSFIIGENTRPVEYDEWKALNRNDIFALDRPATYNWSEKIQHQSDILLFSSIALPLSVALTRNSSGDLGAVGMLTFESLALSLGLTNLTKNLAKRKRPFNYNPEMVPWDLMKKQDLMDARRSFFSGHTSTTAAMYFLGAQMYSDFHPDSDFRTVAWISAATIPAVTGFLRVKGGKHYFTDVLTGYAVGALIGILIPRLHK